MPDGNTEHPTKGTPQGGIISPLLANVVLNELDHWIESQWQCNPVTENYAYRENAAGLSLIHIYSGMGQNYLRSLLALGFQAFLIIVCVAIYAVLVQNIALEDDIIMAIWSCVGYTVLLCFTLFKTGSLAKSVFQAH